MKRALVTGGSGDIGAAICRRLAADGCYVYVHANRNLAKATALAEEISRTGGAAEAIAFDVTDAEASRVVLEGLVSELPIQVLVNNAGVHDDAVFPGMSADQWHKVLAVSLDGFFHVTQPLTMPMIRSRWGRIVNITSIAGLTGNRGQVNYAAAKGGLHAATKSLSLELASRGITVRATISTPAPGGNETTTRTGLVGYDCAAAAEANSARANAPARGSSGMVRAAVLSPADGAG